VDRAAQLVALELLQAVVSRNWLWQERILAREDLDFEQLVVEMARLAAGMGERMFVMPGGFQAQLERARNVLGDAGRAG
jgi:hypothetical protein